MKDFELPEVEATAPDSLRGEAIELTLEQEYELWCHYWDMQKEQNLASWGVENLDDIDHDW